MLSLAVVMSDRYTLLAAPFGAVLLAGLFHRAQAHKVHSQLRRGLKVAVACLILVSVVVGLIDLSLAKGVLAIAVLAGGLILGLGIFTAARNERWISQPVAISLALLGIVPAICIGLGHLALPDQGEQIARTLRYHQLLRGQANYQPIIIFEKPALAAKIRMFTSGDAELHCYRDANTPGALQAAEAAEWILATRKTLDTLGWERYRCTVASEGLFADISTWDMHRARQRTFAEIIQSRRTTMLLAQRQSAFTQPKPASEI